jgi:hypothetical protein
MDRYQQIIKLAEAAMLIREVVNACDPEIHDVLQDIVYNIADTADQIEGAE